MKRNMIIKLSSFESVTVMFVVPLIFEFRCYNNIQPPTDIFYIYIHSQTQT